MGGAERRNGGGRASGSANTKNTMNNQKKVKAATIETQTEEMIPISANDHESKITKLTSLVIQLIALMRLKDCNKITNDEYNEKMTSITHSAQGLIGTEIMGRNGSSQ